jgi:hypothetical protein
MIKKYSNSIFPGLPGGCCFKTIIRDRYPNDFAKASTHMAGRITLIFPAAQGQVRNKRRIASMDLRGRGDGRSRERGRRTTMMSGVDVSDPRRSFTPNEWNKLQEGNYLASIFEQRTHGSCGRRRGRGGRYGARDGGRGGRGGGRQGRKISLVSSVTDTNDNNNENTNVSSGTGNGGQGSTRRGRGGVTFGRCRYAQQE